MRFTAAIDASFGHWLAGFIDGEGCFSIVEDMRTGNFCCRFAIGVRADDLAVLEEIRERTGLGRVSVNRSASRLEGNGNPVGFWDVGTRDDCLDLVRLLEAFPLRAKKERDFRVWRVAVLEWHRGQQFRLRGLKTMLSMARTYRDEGPVGVLVSEHWSPMRAVEGERLFEDSL